MAEMASSSYDTLLTLMIGVITIVAAFAGWWKYQKDKYQNSVKFTTVTEKDISNLMQEIADLKECLTKSNTMTNDKVSVLTVKIAKIQQDLAFIQGKMSQ